MKRPLFYVVQLPGGKYGRAYHYKRNAVKEAKRKGATWIAVYSMAELHYV